MLFRPYAKMPGDRDRPSRADIGGAWIALEKLHGAQLVLGVQQGRVYFGKRKAWLADDDSFFGWQLVRAQLAVDALAVASRIASPNDCVYFYGELFGGRYPHPDVEPIAELSPVQTGVWYARDLRWSPFDILVARSDDDEGELLAYRELEALAREVKWIPAPVVRRGARADLAMLSIRRTTLVPALLGLPPLENNVAEGLVIKADQRIRWSERNAYKRKIEEFDEARFDESGAWDMQQVLSLDELIRWAERLVNPARIASAVSKCGRHDRQAVLDEAVLDVRVDLEQAFPLACRSLDFASEKALDAQILGRLVDLSISLEE